MYSYMIYKEYIYYCAIKKKIQKRENTVVLILVLCCFLDTSESSGTTGTNQTHLTSSRTFSSNGRWHTNVLMVTTSVRMLYRIFGYTTNLRPTIALHGILVVGASGLQQGFVCTSTTSHNTDLGTNIRWDCLFPPGG